MADFLTAETESEVIDAVRGRFRAYAPESDSWAQPNFFSVMSTVIGGLWWSAVNEARRGFDVRVNLQTAQGEYLDAIAATPPLNLVRRTATVATGSVIVSDWPDASIPAGQVFQTAGGVKFQATETVNVGGPYAVVEVAALVPGTGGNSLSGQPMTAKGAAIVSLGVFGGYDDETDDQFRARIYGESTPYAFFGSACSYERMIVNVPGVSRAWAVEDGGTVRIVFLMEGKYPCGEPTAADVAEVIAHFDDPCLTPLFFCPDFQGACTRSIDLIVDWETAPEDLCTVEKAFESWLRENYGLGEGVRGCDISAWFNAAYPEYGPSIACCEDFPPVSCCVYNCANLTPACENEVGTTTFTLADWHSRGIIPPLGLFVGDLRDVNPGLPPGAFYLSAPPPEGEQYTVAVDPSGSFTVTSTSPDTGLYHFRFDFEYRAGGALGTGQAIHETIG